MAPTWEHVLAIECMRITTSPGRLVPTMKKKTMKYRVVLSRFVHIHLNTNGN
jgi:hypothetical protein